MNAEEAELIDHIYRAFSGVRLDNGVSLNMTEHNDSSGCLPAFREKALGDERDDWAAIPDETLEQFTVTFSFTDLKGFRFYIPAYMIWYIRNHRTSDSSIVDSTPWVIDPTSRLFETVSFLDWFTEDQTAAMKDFLEYAARDDESERENLIKIARAPQSADCKTPEAPQSPH